MHPLRFPLLPGGGVCRAACGMSEGMKGVLIRSVYPCSHAYGKLRAGDILLSFDGVQVACDGTVPFRTGERIAFGERAGASGRPLGTGQQSITILW
jgi:hypothetical protein